MLLKEKTKEALALIKSRLHAPAPTVALVLGSGLGRFADFIEEAVVIPTEEIPHYPRSTVPGHSGRWFIGRIHNVPIIALQGRVHYYEGYSLPEVVFPIHLLAGLGVNTLLVTTASGGLNPNYSSGDLMVITDQIKMIPGNPLIGKPENLLGPRFPDLSSCYDAELIRLAMQTGADMGIALHQGVFCCMTGPAYETAAEVRMLQQLGGDAVSMSTAPEVIAARQRHMRVLGIALITNAATGITADRLSHHEVTETANKAGDKLGRLLMEIIVRMENMNK